MRTAWLGPEGGKDSPFGEQESISGDAQRGMMMKAAASSSFVLAKTEFLLKILVVPLDPPTQFRGGHQRLAADGRGQS